MSSPGRLVPGLGLPGGLLPVLAALVGLSVSLLLLPLGLLLHALLPRRLASLPPGLALLSVLLALGLLGLRLEALALGLLLEPLTRLLPSLRPLPVALLGLLEAHRGLLLGLLLVATVATRIVLLCGLVAHWLSLLALGLLLKAPLALGLLPLGLLVEPALPLGLRLEPLALRLLIASLTAPLLLGLLMGAGLVPLAAGLLPLRLALMLAVALLWLLEALLTLGLLGVRLPLLPVLLSPGLLLVPALAL